MLRRLLLTALLAAVCSHSARAAEPDFVKPTPNKPDEPLAKELSLDRAAAFLDNAAVTWTRNKQCGTCHTNFPYLLARPTLSAKKDVPAGVTEVRKFFEDRVGGWDKDKPRNDTEVVATAVTLAYNDAQATGKLSPLARQALDRMWTLQRDNGAWNWEKCDWPPFEHDDYYGAAYAALGVSVAPDGYADTDQAKPGLAKLRKYFAKTPAPDLHHKLWLLWASLKLDGLMTAAERAAAVKDLRALQRDDGGWSLPSLGDWKGFDGRANDKTAASDGYGTGLAVFILRQAGTPAKDEAVRKGVVWLKANQRESGRWFTKSLNTDKAHFITNAGTAFAVLALQSCAETER